MNYRHIFHAGNFGDVLKHVTLIAILQALQRKDTPFCFFDTHAGIGKYDLLSETAQKNPESLDGILRIINAEQPPALIKEYLRCVNSFNPDDGLAIYPGSPAIAKYFMRAQDKMILCELHEEDAQTLKRNFRNDKQVAVHFQDGYAGLKAFLPPQEKRGVVLIDPPYEKHEEYDVILKSLDVALQRFQQGVYAIWYPIKDFRSAERFVQRLRERVQTEALNIELSVYPALQNTQLNGSGMFIVNPPYQLDIELNKVVPWLWKHLSKQQLGQWHVD